MWHGGQRYQVAREVFVFDHMRRPRWTLARAKEPMVDFGSKGIRVDLSGAVWRKTSQGGPDLDNRVEVAFVDGAVAVRDSKDQGGTVLIFTPQEWDAFVEGAKDGEFDLA